jgi:beta-lactamase superfamily II metal-dependent hydrolase
VSIFTLEALQAEQGDSLLIHFGPESAPTFVLVDGGPGSATYNQILLPRLKALRARFSPQQPLALPLAVCSHIDNDHIGGIIALVVGVGSANTDTVAIDCLWHNSFRRLAPNLSDPELKQVLAEIPHIERYADESDQAIYANNFSHQVKFGYATASISQGDRLYAEAERAKIAVNCGFPGELIVAPAGGVGTYQVGELALTVLGPDQDALDALRKKWQKAAALGLDAVIAANDDPSIENLSSVVFLAEYNGQTILMTGDARGDYIIDGLKRAKRFGEDGIDLDVLKVQHHGSSHNNDGQFFHDVRARHYVISANGMYDNPDLATLDNILGGRGFQSGYTIWLTNRGQPGSDLRQMLDAFMSKWPEVDIRFRDETELSLKVDLGTPVAY